MGQRGKIYLKKRLSAVIGEFDEKSAGILPAVV